MLVIGAHSLVSHWSDVLSGITQGSALGHVFYAFLRITHVCTIYDIFVAHF